MKDLEKLSLQELFKLFPISLEENDPKYKVWYKEKEQELLKLLGDKIVRISHIGSTAVDEMISKPIVDILIEVKKHDLCVVVEELKKNWIYMGQWEDPFRVSFNQGYLPTGYADRVFHLHLLELGNPDHLYFRDILKVDKDIFEGYILLKRKLLAECKGDREAYTQGKTDFINEASELGKKKFKNRYDLGKKSC